MKDICKWDKKSYYDHYGPHRLCPVGEINDRVVFSFTRCYTKMTNIEYLEWKYNESLL